MTRAFPRPDVVAELETGLGVMGLDLAPAQRESLVAYLELLHRWNAAFNLSAVRDPLAMVTRHVLDSLVLLPWLGDQQRVLDVGSGAGLPGIPLALARPGLRVTLLDSQGKKLRFLRHVRGEFALDRVIVVGARMENWSPDECFDTVTARACTRLDRLVSQVGHLVADSGCILAMKGRFDAAAETAELPSGWHYHGTPVSVPGLEAERSVVRVDRSGSVSTGERHG